MLLRLFKNNRTGGILFIIFLTLALWLPSLNRTVELPVYRDMPFYNLVFGNLYLHPLLSGLLALAIMVIIAIMLVRLNIRFFLIEERSYMPATFFLLIASSDPAMHHVSPVLAGSLFFMIVLTMLFSAYNAEKNSLAFFNASLVLALGIMFYGKLIWFIPLFWIIVATIRQPAWRELNYPLLAIAILALFLFTWYLFIPDSPRHFRMISDSLRIEGSLQRISYSWMTFLSYLFFVILLASLFLLQRFHFRKIYVRNFYQALFFTFIYIVLVFVLVSGFDYKTLIPAAIPLSYLLSNYFHTRKNRITGEIMLWLFVVLALGSVWVLA